jgi:hypothetical protein
MVAAATSRAAGEGPRADAARHLVPEPPEGLWYALKCRVLGPPLVTAQRPGQGPSRTTSGRHRRRKRTRSSLRQPGQATVQGRLRTAQTRSASPAGSSVLACEITDSTGELTALFFGRARIDGIEPGTRIRLHGQVGIGSDDRPVMTNPAYELLA